MKVVLCCNAKVGNYKEQWGEYIFWKEGIFVMGKVHMSSFQVFLYT